MKVKLSHENLDSEKEDIPPVPEVGGWRAGVPIDPAIASDLEV